MQLGQRHARTLSRAGCAKSPCKRSKSGTAIGRFCARDPCRTAARSLQSESAPGASQSIISSARASRTGAQRFWTPSRGLPPGLPPGQHLFVIVRPAGADPPGTQVVRIAASCPELSKSPSRPCTLKAPWCSGMQRPGLSNAGGSGHEIPCFAMPTDRAPRRGHRIAVRRPNACAGTHAGAR